MASIELIAEGLVVSSRARDDGRWVVALTDVAGNTAEVVLPADEPHWTARQLGISIEEQTWVVRGELIARAYRGAAVIVGPMCPETA